MPIFAFTCPECSSPEVESIRPSWQDAKNRPETCLDCGQAMQLIEVVRVSFTQFTPFRTAAFSESGQEIEVTDRGQLRDLLRRNQMIEKGDTNHYFGSDPRSIPTLEEITKYGKGGPSEKTVAMMKAGMVGAIDAKNWKDMRQQDKATRSGSKGKIRMTERERRTLYELKNKGGVALAR